MSEALGNSNIFTVSAQGSARRQQSDGEVSSSVQKDTVLTRLQSGRHPPDLHPVGPAEPPSMKFRQDKLIQQLSGMRIDDLENIMKLY